MNTITKEQVSGYIGLLNSIIDDHCSKMGLYQHNPPKKKRLKIVESILITVLTCNISPDELIDFINDVEADNVIDITFFNKGGNIFNYMNPRWHHFLSELWTKTPLGTPNSASGEGELMFVFSSKHISKPTKGDLLVNGKKYELKGSGVRVSGDVTGKNFRNSTVALCEKYNLTPNSANKTSLKAVELEKKSHQKHWNNELKKLPLEQRKQFVADYLKCIDNNEHNVDNLFYDGHLNYNELIKMIVKILYRSMVSKGEFDEFMILGDGKDVKIFNTDIDLFNESVDSEYIKLESDYFRINQDFNIGWYIS